MAQVHIAAGQHPIRPLAAQPVPIVAGLLVRAATERERRQQLVGATRGGRGNSSVGLVEFAMAAGNLHAMQVRTISFVNKQVHMRLCS